MPREFSLPPNELIRDSAIQEPLKTPVKPVISGSVLAKSELMRVFDENLLLRIAESGAIQNHGDGYLIPIRIPGEKRPGGADLGQTIPHGRSIHTPPQISPPAVFLGVGEPGHGGHSYDYDKKYGLAAHWFRGGLLSQEVERRVNHGEILLAEYEKSMDEPFMKKAFEYGVSQDMFVTPAASFRPEKLPVVKSGELNLAGQDAVLREIGVPGKKIPEQRILMYSVTVPERIDDFPNIRESMRHWDNIFGYYGYELEQGNTGHVKKSSDGGREKYETAASKVLYGAASRYAVFLRLVHKNMDSTCTNMRYTDDDDCTPIYIGSVFQHGARHANSNPLNLFDYSGIYSRKQIQADYLAVELEARQEKDNSLAGEVIGLTAEKLGIPGKKKRAEMIYSQIYGL